MSGDATLKKSQVASYKNLGRFYRVPFKSILRVQIKQAIISNGWTEIKERLHLN